MRLLGPFQVCLLFLSVQKQVTKKNQPTKWKYANKKTTTIFCAHKNLRVKVVCFALWCILYAQNFFVKKDKQTWNCPNNLIYIASQKIPSQETAPIPLPGKFPPIITTVWMLVPSYPTKSSRPDPRFLWIVPRKIFFTEIWTHRGSSSEKLIKNSGSENFFPAPTLPEIYPYESNLIENCTSEIILWF